MTKVDKELLSEEDLLKLKRDEQTKLFGLFGIKKVPIYEKTRVKRLLGLGITKLDLQKL